MDEIKQRLQETGEECFKRYEAWRGDEKDNKVREQLQDAIHELRKVASRLEIELAVSERNQMASKPLPIPPHRAAQGKVAQGAEDDGGRNAGPKSRKPSGGRSGGPRKKAADGNG